MSEISDEARSLLSMIAAAFRLEVHEDQENGNFNFVGGPWGSLDPVTISVANQLADNLRSAPIRGVARWTDTTYEVLLVIEDPIVNNFRFRRVDFTLSDPERGLEYRLGEPSRELSIGLLAKLRPEEHREIASRVRRAILPPRYRERENGDVFDLVCQLFRRHVSLQITSREQRAPVLFKRSVNSFLFHVAYNLDLPLAVASAEALFPPMLARRGARQDEEPMDAPRLSYDEELVSRYVAATATSDVVGQYLGYYHVLEGQFEPLYNDFVVGKVRDTLTAPGFSIRRDSDISALVKGVSRLVRERQNETAGIDERRALRLVLGKYVSVDRVVSRLGSEEYLDELRQGEVTFSGGEKVDLAGPDQAALDALASRIYKTRNAVVHAKASEEKRYRPRRDVKELERETRLMRALAEEVIVGTSRMLE